MSKLNLHPQFLVNDKGQRTSVLLPIEEFNELLEDLDDQLVLVERKKDVSIPFKQAMAELGIQDHV